jgi:DNA polymerase III gamma/tau subunit
VQIAAALVDNMRDLMVVKSAGAESELLAYGAEHRKRASELAEMFDIAGLIYNITTLEKLRWTIKNSETARALLEASLLRLALSEHFLNVDSLLSQTKTSSASSIKKNKIADRNSEITGTEKTQAKPTTNKPKTNSQKKNEIVSDPAVKTVLMELGAKITGIEELENHT